MAGELITRLTGQSSTSAPVLAQAIDDVALGDDAGDPAVLDHRQGADPLLAEPADGVEDGVVGSDRLDRAALVPGAPMRWSCRQLPRLAALSP